MNSRIIYLFVWVFVTNLSAQNYYVINVKGQVLIEGQELQKGDQIDEDVSLSFNDQDAVLYLLSTENGYLAISPEQKKVTKSKELIVALRQAILPKNKNHLTASRGDGKYVSRSFADKYDMMAYFRNKIALFEKNSFAVAFAHKADFDKAQLVAMSKAGQPLIFELPLHDGVLDINTKVLDLKPGNYKLSVLNDDDTMDIGKFFINLVSQEEIAQEFRVIANNTSGLSDQEVFNAVFVPYFHSYHGHIDPDVLKSVVL